MSETSTEHAIYSDIEALLAIRFHVKRRRLTSQQKLLSSQGGYHQAIRKGRGMEFNEVREYTPGDDIRHIDWKVSARTQKIHTKLFTEELEQPVICLVEQTPKLFFGSRIRFKSVQALNIASALAWVTVQQGDRFGGYVFNPRAHHWVEPKHQQTAVTRFLHACLDLQKQVTSPTGMETDWISHLAALQHHIKGGSRLFLIGDFLDMPSAFHQQLIQLKKRADITLIHLFDPIEKSLPAKGLLQLTDGQQQLNIDTDTSEQNQLYQVNYQRSWQALSETCNAGHIPLVEVSSQADPVQALITQKVIY
ncbi:MAG: DUF58 domain-containing protein [Hydrogenovibrio sp.]|nr:DUF58 domain-containing protein [Hydrogenovibrio sp.]